MIAIIYIPPRADFDKLKTHNYPVYVFGDLNTYHRLLGNRQTNDSGEQYAELLEID